MFSIVVISCAERAICPAYQSAFIHDKVALDRHFSYFGEDTLPKNQLTASKDKFLIIERVPYKKKVRSLNTVPMQTIYPVLDDSTALSGDVQMLTEMDVVDSLALDSAVQNELPWKEKFNVEQEFYFHYFNDILVYPEERAQAELDKKDKGGEMKGAKQGFFKRIFGGIFKKGKKNSNDLAEDEELDENAELDETQQPKKKGLKGLFSKKNKKNSKKDSVVEPIPEEGEEDLAPVDESSNEDDDF